ASSVPRWRATPGARRRRRRCCSVEFTAPSSVPPRIRVARGPGRCGVRSPDADALGRGQPEGVGFTQVKGLIEGVDVANDLIAPELVGRVRVDREEADDLLVAGLHLPRLGPGEEEPLRAGQPIDDGSLRAAERQLVGLPRDAEPAEVADVLTDCERAVDVVLGRLLGRKRVVLLDEHLRQLLERRTVLRRPPVDQPAVAVEARTLVVESVSDLVPDDGADRTIVCSVIPALIEE